MKCEYLDADTGKPIMRLTGRPAEIATVISLTGAMSQIAPTKLALNMEALERELAAFLDRAGLEQT